MNRFLINHSTVYIMSKMRFQMLKIATYDIQKSNRRAKNKPIRYKIWISHRKTTWNVGQNLFEVSELKDLFTNGVISEVLMRSGYLPSPKV
jgi:hypothetical protein